MGLCDGNGYLGSRTKTVIITDPVFADALNIAEIATPSTPDAGYVKVYPKADGKMYILDDTGKESMLEVPLNTLNTVIVDASALVQNTWLEIIAATSGFVRRMQVFDTSGNTLQFSFDAVPVNANVIHGAGSNETTDIEAAAGSKLWVKTANVGPYEGNIVVNLLG
jgi:hypothetical protein